MNDTTNSPAAQPQEANVTMAIDELLELHPLPWTHHLLLIKDANGRRVIHTGGSYNHRGRIYEGRYLSGLNALLVQLVNARADLPRATADDEDALHLAICQAVHLMNQGDIHAGHDLLRQTLVDYADKKAPLSRSEIIRQQQRDAGSEVTATMISPTSKRDDSNEQ